MDVAGPRHDHMYHSHRGNDSRGRRAARDRVLDSSRRCDDVRGAGALLPAYVEATGVNAVSIDWAAEPSLIRERVQNRVAVQGNLDPLALIAGGAALDRAVDDVLANYAAGRLIFNLGHGIQPETPIAHVEQMLRRVRAYKG